MKSRGILRVAFCVFAFSGAACQNKPCREIQAERMAQKKAEEKVSPGVVSSVSEKAATSTTPTGGKMPNGAKSSNQAGQLRVKVYKADGSLQCGMGKKITLEDMEKELKGIQVFSRSNQNDGLMRIQVCGAPTGQSNVYEISRSDLEKALKAGFKEWTQD
jgi:hypothetical protein